VRRRPALHFCWRSIPTGIAFPQALHFHQHCIPIGAAFFMSVRNRRKKLYLS